MTETLHILIGSQEDAAEQGISHAELDCATGQIRLLGIAAEVRRPTWLLPDRERGLLFSVSEIGNKGDAQGEVLSFGLGDRAAPLLLRDRTSSLGGGATHLTLDRACHLFVANFGGANAAAMEVTRDGIFKGACSTPLHSGSGPHRRQQAPHPHGVTIDPTGRYLLVPDMGTDQIVVHAFDSASMAFGDAPASITPTPAGSGPRLLLFGNSGRHAYLLSELSAELFVFDWNAEAGELVQVGVVSLDKDPDRDGEPSAAALEMSADGRFLYASNRRTHCVQVYAIAPGDGALSPVQSVPAGGERPWHVALSPDGDWLVASNQASNRLQVFAVDRERGVLSAVEGGTLSVPTPTCVAFTGL